MEIEVQKDFYKSEVIKMGYFKTPEGLQLYELSLAQLKEIYKEVKS
ncbi:Fur-regulated basic protein FbpA [Bacillus sp. PPSBB_2]